MDEKGEMKDMAARNGNAEKEKTNSGESTVKDKTDRKDIIKTILVWVAIIGIVVIGFASGCVRCTNCGADDTRFFVYASGTSTEGIDYKSCVGPAGCLGFGLNSKCWPTECTSVKGTTVGGNDLSGCVTYYNAAGCVANSEVKSEGKYSNQITCMGIGCAGTKYVETVAETTKAKEQSTCLGIGCGNSTSVEAKDYNSIMPRQFSKGCWSNE